MKKVLFLLFFVLSSVFLQTAPVEAKNMPNFIANVTSSPQKQAFPPQSKNEIIVRFKNNPTAKTLINVAQQNDKLDTKYGISSSNLVVYTVKEGTRDEAINDIKSNTDVLSVFPNYQIDLFTLPNDPAIKATPASGQPRVQWDMFNIKIAGETSSSWDKTTGSSSITVAVIDSGIDSTHPEFSGKTIFVDCNTDPCQRVSSMNDNPDPNKIHGTHVSGILAAATNNAAGMAGAGYNTKIMMVKIMNDDGEMTVAGLMRAINYVVDYKTTDNIKVINMSLGALAESLDQSAIDALHVPIQRAYNAGIVMVGSAGNAGGESNSKSYPAAYPEVISVAAMGVDNKLASYSEYNDTPHGNWISVAAPGGDCTSTADVVRCIASSMPTNITCSVPVGPLGTMGYCYMAGTSQAAPHVAAVAAMMFAANSNLTSEQVRQFIQTTANKSYPADNPNATNYGGVDALAAISAVTSDVTPTTIVSTTPVPGAPTVTPNPPQQVRLPKTLPVPYPTGPYCPADTDCPKKTGGDADCDGNITEADYDIWKGQFDTMVPPGSVNSNANFYCKEGDSSTYFVDLVDYEVWRRNKSW